MTASPTTIETELAELVEESFTTFCEEIGAMFEWEMESERKDVVDAETVKGLQKRFKKFVAVYDVRTKGVLNGTFQVIFDHAGLFTLAGMIVMLPDKLINNHRKCGTVKEAGEINDSIKEAGNLFIGSMDKVFREGMEGHGHFLHTNTYVGEPWKESRDRTGEAFADEFLLIVCEMKIDPYPPFQCGVAFPKNVYDGTADVEPEVEVETESQDQTATAEDAPPLTEETVNVTPETDPSAVVAPEAQAEPEQPDQTVKTENDRSASEETEQAASDVEPPKAIEPEAPDEDEQQGEAEKAEDDRPSPEEKAQVKDEGEKAVVETVSPPTDNTSAKQAEPSEQIIGSDIKHEAAVNAMGEVSGLCAKDIMQENVLWCSSEEGMGEVLAKMCQSGMNCALIGPQGTPEGIVSMSDLRAGMSPYLRPEFAQWRRPIDDASLRIKVKWLMSKDIHTVKSQDGLSDVASSMCHLKLHSMPVVGREGKIEGVVDVFDILRTLSRSDMKVAM
jgi:predicted transcriptional regulator